MIRQNNKWLTDKEMEMLAKLITGYGNLSHCATIWKMDEQTIRNISRRGYGLDVKVNIIRKKLQLAAKVETESTIQN